MYDVKKVAGWQKATTMFSRSPRELRSLAHGLIRPLLRAWMLAVRGFTIHS